MRNALAAEGLFLLEFTIYYTLSLRHKAVFGMKSNYYLAYYGILNELRTDRINMDFSSIILNVATGAPGFLLAIVCHEAAHAYMAYRFGDNTAKMHGRLTLNPMAHIDIFGTVVFPLIGAMLGGVMFGWAKPVPIDVRSFKNIRKGVFWVSFAGPLTNIILGILSAFMLVFMVTKVPVDFFLFKPFVSMAKTSVYINFILAVFNLIPFPPLDGSKMVTSFLDYNAMRRYEGLARYSLVFFLILMFTNAFRYILAPAFMAADFLIYNFYQLLS
jgi:Zn-dependent protease